VQFRAEIFNFPNIVNLDNPTINPTSGSFGRVVGKGSTTGGRASGTFSSV
jgi:hypothetical protein